MFSGKVILITGSSSGIGAGAAIHFSMLGASVVITGRNVEKLNKVAKQCEDISKRQPFVIIGDLSDEEFIKTLLDRTIKHYKKLDVLINNAGMGGGGGIQTTPMELYDKIFKVNLDSVYLLTKLAVPYLIETKGTIVNVSSNAGLRPFPQALAYCMSKSSLDHFTRCIALELASKQVRVNSVNPGPVYTDICQNSGMSDEQAAKVYERCKDLVPLGHVGSVEEIAEAIAFLAGEDSSYVTGVTMAVDAGHSIMSPL